MKTIMGLFGKTPQKTPRDQCREWTGKLRKQGFLLDREVRKIEREELKIQNDLKDAAKKNKREVVAVLAKELVRSKKAKNRLHAAKSQINSISMIIQEQMSTVQMASSLQRSTEVMKNMQNLISVQTIASTMQDLSREMMKTGIISEMLDDAVEDAIDDEPIEDEIQAEIDKVLSEVGVETGAKLAQVPSTRPAGEKQQEPATSSNHEQAEDEEDLQKMQKRLEQLKS